MNARVKLNEQKKRRRYRHGRCSRFSEARRGRRPAEESSLIGIEHSIRPQPSVDSFQSNAHDVAALWTATEAGIKGNIQEQLDVVDEKLRQTNLAEAEPRNRLLEERRGIVAAGAAMRLPARRLTSIATPSVNSSL